MSRKKSIINQIGALLIGQQPFLNSKEEPAHVRRHPPAANTDRRAEPRQPVCADCHRLYDGLRRSAPHQFCAWRNLHDRDVHRLLRHLDVLSAVVCDLYRDHSCHGTAGYARRTSGVSSASQCAAHLHSDFRNRRVVLSPESGDRAFRRTPADLSADSAVHGCAENRRRLLPASLADCSGHCGGSSPPFTGSHQAHQNRPGDARRLPRLRRRQSDGH